MIFARDPLDDPLDDLISGSAPAPRAPVAPPATYQPQTFPQKCSRCAGSGSYRGFGRCFSCGGTGKAKGKREFKTSPEVRAKARTARVQKKRRTAEENLAAFKLEHPEVFAWFDGNVLFPFAIAMRDAVAKYGSLTANQMAACRRLIDKLNATKAAAKARVETAQPIDTTKIEAAFGAAGASLKRPKLRAGGFTISPARKHPGQLYVYGLAADKSEDVYLGKIAGGKFVRSRECSTDQETKFRTVAADPRAAAIEYGRLTGSCACCGRELTDPVSVANGIGPICAVKFGW